MSLFTAEETAARLQDPNTDHSFTLAHMDVENFHFAPRITDEAPAPIVTTGLQGCGIPLYGMLCFDEADYLFALHEGCAPIIGTDLLTPLNFLDLSKTHGLVGTYAHINGRRMPISSHDFVEGQGHTATLLDDPEFPTLIFDPKNKLFQLTNGQKLQAREKITIDPVTGRIWRGFINVIPPTPPALLLETYLTNTLGNPTLPSIGFPVSDFKAPYLAYKLRKHLRDIPTISLLRTEKALVQYRRNKGHRSPLMTDLMAKFPMGHFASWEVGDLTECFENTNYRLIDLTRLPELLSDHTAEQIQKITKEIHIFQINSVLATFDALRRYVPHAKHQTIVVPNVDDGKQALKMRRYIEQAAATQNASDYIHVGYMIETPEALTNIADIVPHASSLCIGSNDLVARLLQTSREVLMRTDPYTSFMSPKIQIPLRYALKTAKQINSTIKINFCGAHTDGTYIPATDAALSMGATMLTIPPHMNNVLRTQAAILRFKAKQKLGMSVP